MRFGTVTILGRPNVGKSTFLNAALGESLAIVSPVPQTTRDALLGVVNRPGAQFAFIDTPGVHRPRTELGKRMNSAALDALRSADLVVMMTDPLGLPERLQREKALTRRAASRAQTALRAPEDASSDAPPPEASGRDENAPSGPPSSFESGVLHPGDLELLKLVPSDARLVLAINKVDRVRDKGILLPLCDSFSRLRNFEAIVPISAKSTADVERLLAVLAPLLPEGPEGYPEDEYTNQPTLFFAREYVREQVLLQTGREVPHATAVTIERYEASRELTRVSATIHVEKVGQRKIVVGSGGTVIREIGRGARLRLEELIGGRVHLELFVRVTPRWRNAPRQLAEMGYDSASSDAGPGEPQPQQRRRRRSPQRKSR